MGGLGSALRIISTLIILCLQTFGSYQYVMGETFYSRSSMSGDSPWMWGTERRRDERNDLQWNSLKSIKITAVGKLPKFCLVGCLRPNHKQI